MLRVSSRTLAQAMFLTSVQSVSSENPRKPGGLTIDVVSGIQPELWVDGASAAVAFYVAAFNARVLHRVGDGDDIVVQLAVGDAVFWVVSANARVNRFSPKAIGGTTSRTLLVVDDPDPVVDQAAASGAIVTSQVGSEHGWRLGRIVDPFGHEWEIGTPLGKWPPD